DGALWGAARPNRLSSAWTKLVSLRKDQEDDKPASTMAARYIRAARAVASTLPRFGSFIAMTWRPRATELTLIRWRIHDERRTCHIRRWLLLGHARPYPTARRRNLDASGVHRW